MPRELVVRVLPVGKGEAVLVVGPTGTAVLINGGADRSILRALGNAFPFFDRSIDAVVASDPNTANIGGLPDVFERYQVRLLLTPGIEDGKAASRALAAASAESGITAESIGRGTRLELGGGAHLLALSPDRAAAALSSEDGALVLRLVYGGTSFLLTSDASPELLGWLSLLDKDDGALGADVVISSSTPAGVYRSDGVSITRE